MEGLLRISEAANLALHAMACLLRAREERALSAQEMAEELGASRDHLSKVLQRLGRMGLVASRRGPRGGFTLGRDPRQVTLLQILEAVDGPLPRGHCLLGRPVCGDAGCVLGDLVRSVTHQVRDYLAGTTLADLPGSPVLGERPRSTRRGKGRR